MDPIKQLLDVLPSPRELLNRLVNHGQHDGDLIRGLVLYFNASTCSDEVIRSLVAFARRHGQVASVFYSIMTRFVLMDKESSMAGCDLSSSQAAKIEFFRWLLRGAKTKDWDEVSVGSMETSKWADKRSSLRYLPPPDLQIVQCANCSTDGHWPRCAACAVDIEDRLIDATFYCSKGCQRAHWADHKPLCRSRKGLHRAVSLTSDLLLAFLQGTFKRSFGQATERDGVLRLVFTEFRERLFRGGRLYTPITDEMLDGDHLKAVLVTQECGAIMCTYGRLMKLFVGPLCERLESVTVAVKDAEMPTCPVERVNDVEIESNVMTGVHSVVRATLESGYQMAVDLTSAQYGWAEILSPWQAFEEHRVLGTCTAGTMSVEEELAAREQDRQGPGKRLLMEVYLLPVVRYLSDKDLLPVKSGLFGLADEEYRRARDDILAVARDGMAKMMGEILKSNAYRYFLGADGEIKLTRTTEESVALERVWITEEEWAEHEDDGTWLEKTWVDRCKAAMAEPAFAELGLPVDF